MSDVMSSGPRTDIREGAASHFPLKNFVLLFIDFLVLYGIIISKILTIYLS